MGEKKIVSKLIDIIMVLAMISIVCVVSLQVLGRTPILETAPHWTEELSRMIFIVIVAFGSISATLNNEFVAVDLLVSKLKGRAIIIYNIIMDAIIGGFFFSLLPACIKFISLGNKQFSPSMRINMGYIYSLIFVAIFGMGIAKVYRIICELVKLKKYGEVN